MSDILDDWLAEDLGNGDITSQTVVKNSICEAEITGGPAVISGLDICKELFHRTHIEQTTDFSNGDRIESRTCIFSLKGKSHDILKVERLVLNLLCHLSGIASFTSEVVKKARSVNPNVEILATRKTIPGMREIEKEAVVHGGGMTHRIRLDDAILIKDNHLNLCKDIGLAIKNSRNAHPNLMIEVEADTLEQALEAAQSGADRVMLDNFSPALTEETVASLRKISDIEIESSGGITLENVNQYAPFVDFISLGSLTMAAPPVDFSLHVN
jgi:nicotinate-nucleotide pyrophosphorylase (carboxylating)|tara:strand:- start:113 stop:922 length:810 start_codon:yes stop_codon:yes gene_type:complete